jgi:pimeloyl-ACP methyl ester carboxylesterase
MLLFAIIVANGGIAACAGALLSVSPAQPEAAGREQSPAPIPPPGRLVDIDGRRLHLNVMGKGRPTVVLVYGAGAFSVDWAVVQPEIAKFTRVVAYDRAGDAWSSPGPQPQTMAQDAYDLHTLLHRARIEPPYVLVGHSLGGPLVRWYTRQYPGEVAGMVLEDATDDDTVLGINGKLVRMRELSKGRPIPAVQTRATGSPPQPNPEEMKKLREFIQSTHQDRIEPPFDRLPKKDQEARIWAASQPTHYQGSDPYLSEELETLYQERHRGEPPLEDIPLVVLIPESAPAPAEKPMPEEMKRVLDEKRKQKIDQARLSRNGKVVFVKDSGHEIHLFTPSALVEAVRTVVEAVRKPLPRAAGAISCSTFRRQRSKGAKARNGMDDGDQPQRH